MGYGPLKKKATQQQSSGYKPKRQEVPVEFRADAPVNLTTKEEVSEEECWKYLRDERNKKLASTDYINNGVQMNPLDMAGLYKYREELRHLPEKEGAPWTPDTIPWPVCPVKG